MQAPISNLPFPALRQWDPHLDFVQAPGVSGAIEKADTSLLECSHGEGGNNIDFLVGSEEVTQIWVEDKVNTWVSGAKRLAEFVGVFT